jgi:hypothetical protein
MYEEDWSILMHNYFCMHLNCLLASLFIFFQSILFSSFRALHVSPMLQYVCGNA